MMKVPKKNGWIIIGAIILAILIFQPNLGSFTSVSPQTHDTLDPMATNYMEIHNVSEQYNLKFYHQKAFLIYEKNITSFKGIKSYLGVIKTAGHISQEQYDSGIAQITPVIAPTPEPEPTISSYPLTVKVTDVDTTQVISGAKVTLGTLIGTTCVNGECTISDVPIGNYTAVIEADYYNTVSKSVTISDSAVTTEVELAPLVIPGDDIVQPIDDTTNPPTDDTGVVSGSGNTTANTTWLILLVIGVGAFFILRKRGVKIL